MASSASTAAEGAPEGLAVQVPLILAVLDALGIAVVGKDGYEADDVIGTLASTAPMPVDVVTGDRDLFQVVDDEREVRVLYIARVSASMRWSMTRGCRHGMGYRLRRTSTTRPCAAMPLMGFRASLGSGDKTAATLLNSYRNLEESSRRPAVRNPRSAARCRQASGGDRLSGGRPHGGRRGTRS